MDQKQRVVQDIDRTKMKEKLYDIATNIGMKLFAEYWGKASLKATDRWIEYPWVISNLPSKPCSILDVGCAGSMFPLLLKSLGNYVMGIDLKPYPMTDKFDFVQGDICIDRGVNDFFNVVTAISTIEHIKESYKAIKEIHRILKPNGLFLMTIPYSFGKARQTKFHFIHNKDTLAKLIKDFDIKVEFAESPETNDYTLALVRATK